MVSTYSELSPIHRIGNLVGPISRETVDAASNQEMRPELLGQTEELIDIALSVADVDVPVRIAERRRRLAQVIDLTVSTVAPG